jgi:hypothetical protein
MLHYNTLFMIVHSLTHRKERLNGISSYSPVLKEADENDKIDKTVPALTKREVPNAVGQLEADQRQERDVKDQYDIKQNNSVPNSLSDSQPSTLWTPTRDKNAVCELDRTASSESHTAMQCIRAHEVAVGKNNERHFTHSDIEVQVDNNLATHVPDYGTHTFDSDDATNHNGTVTRTPRMEMSGSDFITTIPPVPQIEQQSISTISVADLQREEEHNDMENNIQTDLQPSSECEVGDDCDGTYDRKEDSLQPVLNHSEQNSDDITPPTVVSAQQHSDAGVCAPLCDSDKNSVDSQPISSLPKQQPMDTDDQGESPLQNLSDLPPHSSQQLCDTCRVKDDSPQCCVDDNPIDLLPPRVVISSQEQSDALSQLHSDDSSVSLLPHCVVVPARTKQQHLAVDNGKDNPLKQLCSVQTSLSDQPPKGDTVQLRSSENTTVVSVNQQSDADVQREGSSQHLLSNEQSITEPSPVASIVSQQQPHQGSQPVQDQSNQNTIDQQLDAPPLLSKGKSHVNSVASAQQPYQKEFASDTNEHLPNTVTSPRPSGNCPHKDLALLPQPAQLTIVIRRQQRDPKHRKRRQYCSGRVKRSKPRKKRPHSSHTSLQRYRKQGLPHPQPIKDKGPKPTNRNNGNAPMNTGRTDTEKQQGCRSDRRGNSFQPNTQQASSHGGSSNDGGGDDEDGDKGPYSGGRSFHSHPNWILFLLIVLLILCFCFPQAEEPSQQASHIDTESVCSAEQHHSTTSLDLKSSPFPDSSWDDHTPALFRGGIFSKPHENGGEETTSSNTFPEGCSTDHLVSEEETPRDMYQREELAGLEKLHLKRRRRERPRTTPPGSPRPQLDLNVSEPSLRSEPKPFTCPSPENSQEESHDYDTSRRECIRSYDAIGHHMIFQSNCVFNSSRLICGGPSTNVRHILTDANIYQHQHSPPPPLRYIPDLSNADSSNTAPEREEDVEQQEEEDDDPPSQFRGPGTAYKKSPDRSEGRTLDSGVGTNSQTQNQIPATAQTLPVAAAKIDTSWRTSVVKNDEIVYLTPSSENTVDGHRSNFQVVLSVEEQTSRSPNYRNELVATQLKDNEPADPLSLQPSEPLLERRERTSLLLEPSMRVFPYPSPGDECSLNFFQDVPENSSCVFISGSTLYMTRRPSFPVTCSVLTDDTIGRSRQYRRLLYFTTKIYVSQS